MTQDSQAGRDRRGFKRKLSPLRVRILSINVLALIAPIIASLYAIDSHKQFIASAEQDLTSQAELIAFVIGSAADEELALSRPDVLDLIERTANTIAKNKTLTVTRVNGVQIYTPEIYGNALYDQEQKAVSHLNKEETGLVATAAIYAGGTISDRQISDKIGEITLLQDASEIDARLERIRWQSLAILLIGLTLTTLLSLYLSWTIARPLRILSEAADRVRTGLGRSHVEIPKFLTRGDEIADLSRSMDALNLALNERLNAIAAFASDVAHEIRNPLASVRSAVELAMHTDDNAKRERLMTIVLTDSKRLDRLVTDISAMSRLDADLANGTPEAVNLPKLLTSFVRIFEDTGTADSVQFEITPDMAASQEEASSKFMALASEDRLAQVLHNLIGNAISFSPQGGCISLALEEIAADPNRWPNAPDGLVALSITDEGPGLVVGKEQEVFARFYTDRPRNEHGDSGHSGLGLAICKQIVESFGGEISADNRKDGHSGAIFRVLLPRHVARGDK